MSYVFFDLEWNQGYPRNEAEKIDEIIQIGACRLDTWLDQGVCYSSLVKPVIHKHLHHQVRKLLPLNQAALKQAAPFKRVALDFFQWCGEDAVFFTWGTSDARVLDQNLCWHGLEEYLDLEIYDLQRAFDLLVLRTNHQASLEAAVHHLGLEDALVYHDARNDAFYTAQIAAELVRRFGSLPTPEELDRLELEIREQCRRESARQAEEALGVLLAEGKPVLHRRCSHFPSVDACLQSRSARIFHCPDCDNWLCGGNWYRLEDTFLSRSRCLEHGRFYSCLTLDSSDPQGRVQGELRVFQEADFPAELFLLCRQGGERLEVQQMPRKRHRIRKGRAHLRRGTE